MAWRFVKQPNGMLARFSEVCNDFTDHDLTVSEAIDMCVREYKMSRDDANQKVARGILADGRWREALETIEFYHGKATVAERIREMGSTGSR